MPQGLVKVTNPHIIAAVDQVKAAYLTMRRTMDAMIAERAGDGTNSDYEAIAALADASLPGQTDPAVLGQTVFDNMDAALAGMTTAYNALSNMDKNAL